MGPLRAREKTFCNQPFQRPQLDVSRLYSNNTAHCVHIILAMSSDDEVEITGVREDLRKSAEYHRQRADAAVVVKREARKEAQEAREDEAEAEEDVQRMYIMQDGERHRFEYLVRLVERSINEQRVITQDELDHVTKMRWQDAAAANARTKVQEDRMAAAAAAAPPAVAASVEVTSPVVPALLPAKSIKPLSRAIQKLVDAKQAAIDPPGAELLPAMLQAGLASGFCRNVSRCLNCFATLFASIKSPRCSAAFFSISFCLRSSSGGPGL